MSGEGVKRFTHLSASHITAFAQRRAQWWAERVAGMPFEPSAAMIRGQAIEDAVRFVLLGEDIDSAVKKALDQYDADCARQLGLDDPFGKIAKERETIAPSAELAVGALAGFGVPKYDEDGRQQKIELNCRFGQAPDDVIKIIGYLDFVFDDLVIDLKSTGKMPSQMSWGHQVQRAIYARATKMPVKFCYVTPKKVEIKEDGDVELLLGEIKEYVKAMDEVLRLPERAQKAACIPDPDDWGWKGKRQELADIFFVDSDFSHVKK